MTLLHLPVVMNPTSYWLLSLTIAVALPLLIFDHHTFAWLDLIVRVCLAECNRRWNRRRIRRQSGSQTSTRQLDEMVACLVGYREEPRLFEEALRAVKDAKCKCLVVGIDGNGREDLLMLESFQKVSVRSQKAASSLKCHQGFQGREKLHLEFTRIRRQEVLTAIRRASR